MHNEAKEEKDATTIPYSRKNQSKNSNGFTIMSKTQRDIHHLAINKNDKEIKEYIDSLCIDIFSPWNLNYWCIYIDRTLTKLW